MRKKVGLLAIIVFLFGFSVFSNAAENLLLEDFLTDTFQKLIALADNAVDFNSQSIELETVLSDKEIVLAEEVKDLFRYRKSLEDLFSTYTSTAKMNYRLSIRLLSKKEIGELCFYEVAKASEYNYTDLPDVLSKEGRIVQFVTRQDSLTGKMEIIDFFVPDDYELRGCLEELSLYDLYQENRADSELLFLRKSNLKENYDNIFRSTSEYIKQKTEEAENVTPEENADITEINRIPLSKYAIKDYARRNCSKDQPLAGWGDSVAPYYDFSQIPGNYDCTNFASHAILAGGANICYNGNPGTGWYFKSLNDRSYSWSGVPKLRDFLVSNSNIGPYGHELNYRTYSDINSIPYEFGDLIQFYQADGYNNWRHSGIITQFYKLPSSTTQYGVLYCARIAKGIYEYDVKAEKKYGKQPKRVIALDGTR